MRVPALILCCACLFLGGLAAGCGTHKTTRTGWETVTVDGHTYVVTPIATGQFTLTTKP
jgi:hypothetical protein